jgi:hypothetical protein
VTAAVPFDGGNNNSNNSNNNHASSAHDHTITSRFATKWAKVDKVYNNNDRIALPELTGEDYDCITEYVLSCVALAGLPKRNMVCASGRCHDCHDVDNDDGDDDGHRSPMCIRCKPSVGYWSR